MLIDLLFIALLPYWVMLLYWAIGLSKLNAEKEVKKKDHYPLSVVIAFRNEAKNLAYLMGDLQNLDYPNDLLEVILINDHSNDESLDVINNNLKKNLDFKLLSLTAESGKKAAIRKGVEAAKNSLIVTTDADCRFKPNWLSTLTANFDPQKDHLLTAPVQFHEAGFWQNIFQTEQAALMAATAATIANQSGFMCNGANLMFPKALYQELKQEELKIDVASGDDVFLLHAIKSKFGKQARIKYATDRNATVKTDFPSRFSTWIHQRLRWAEKSKQYQDSSALLHGAIILIANLALLLSVVGSLLGQMPWQISCLLFALKWLGDYVLISSIRPWFKVKSAFFYSLPLSLLYPLYSLLIALLSLLLRPKWKGRKI